MAGLFLSSSGVTASAGNSTGMNVGKINHYWNQWIFVDVMKLSGKFRTANNSSSATFTADSNGYPTQVPQAGVNSVASDFDHSWEHWPVGDYTLIFDGDGTVTFLGVTCDSNNGLDNSCIVPISSSQSDGVLKITRSDSADHVRNIRLIMPGFVNSYQTQIFHPEYLRGWAGFDVIRFGNWQKINESASNLNWSERTTTQTYNQTGDWGIAPEYVIELCNRINSDCYISIPENAPDSYVRGYAQLIKQNLNVGLKVYVEYSNEIWNSGFSAFGYCRDQGLQKGFDTNNTAATQKYQVFRSSEIWQIFEQELGDDRVVNVLSGQAANSSWAERLLEYSLVSTYNPSATLPEVFAIAPYVGGEIDNEMASGSQPATVDAVFNRLNHWLNCTDSSKCFRQEVINNLVFTNQYGIDLVAYEGGQGLDASGRSSAIASVFYNAQNDPRMQIFYNDMFAKWDELNPGKLFIGFTYSSPYTNNEKYWGMFEYQDQMNTQKFLAYQTRLNSSETPVDTTPPITVVSPSGGSYQSSQPVTLSINESGLTYYCFGSDCNPTTLYASAISISESSVLRFYSRDSAGNQESTKQETYTITVMSCGENWSCGAWSVCNNNIQTRNCNDLNNCGTTINRPTESQGCTTSCTPNWSCGVWSACNLGGSEVRTCTDVNACGISSGQPDENRTCTYINNNSGGDTDNSTNNNNDSSTNSQTTSNIRKSFHRGRLVKLSDSTAIYHIASDGKRRLFSNAATFWTWYTGSWSDIDLEVITRDEFDAYGIGQNVTVRPGSKLIRFKNSNVIYAIGDGDQLCRQYSLYNNDWINSALVIQPGFESDYTRNTTCDVSSHYPDGSLIQYSGSENIWYIDIGQKRLVTNEIFSKNQFKNISVITGVNPNMTFETGLPLDEF
ncbi:MAG TPA: chitobiase/beta-hexosaminidase C-terminal domain-containing protein [Patescibacteria group bacterium]|nr:chitobiase/beta-hexosaminidase C-terminal domain-containing protein [Patescibacteria group bacterium]